MLNKTILLTALAAALTATGALAATFDVFTSEEAWKTAVGEWQTEDFEGQTLNTGLSVETDYGNISGGVWKDRLTTKLYDHKVSTTVFSFETAINSFGAVLDIRPEAAGTGITLIFLRDGNMLDTLDVAYNTKSSFFWGLTAGDLFDEVVFQHGGTPAARENFHMEYMMYGLNLIPEETTESTTAVPLPASIWMFVSALIGMTFVRRRSRTQRP